MPRPATTRRSPTPAPSSAPSPNDSTVQTAAEQGITLVGIRHLSCRTESRPPRWVLDKIEDGTWGAGLTCSLCQAYRPLAEFEMVSA